MKHITYQAQYLTLTLFLALVFACSPSKDPNAEVVKVTLTEGTNMAAALSPDQELLALDLQGTIWVMPVEGGLATPISDEFGDCHEPSWSPDGEKIAYHSYKSGNYQIWTIGKDGSDLTQVTSGPYDAREPVWSADGTKIIFSSDRNGNYDIFEVLLSDLSVTQLTQDEANEYHPAVGPDNKIVFVSEKPDAPGIYAISGGESSLLSQSKVELASPTWSPDGKSVLFVSYSGTESALSYLDLSTGELSTVSEPGEDIFPFKASWLSDSSFIYTADGDIKVKTFGVTTTETIAFSGTVTLNKSSYQPKIRDFDTEEPTTPMGIMGPVVSPDGSQVAFTALSDIYIQSTSDTSIINLTNDVFVDIDPEWSPDGKKIIFSSDRGGKMDLWIKDLETGDLLQVTSIEEIAAFPSWSPDGQKIAFYAVDARNVWGRGTLSLLDLASGEVEQIFDPLFVPSKVSWHPDGKSVALMALDPYSSRYREGISKMVFLSLETKESTFFTPTPDETTATRGQNGPLWSPDGKWIAYVQEGVIKLVGVEDGKPTSEPITLTDKLSEKPSWTADSKKLVYMATDHLEMIDVEDKAISEIEINLNWSNEKAKGSYVVYVGKLFDGVSEQYLENMDIVVEDNRIKEIVPHVEGRTGVVIDASDKTIIPGLFEMHTHQHASVGEKLGRTWLSYGITSVREPGADPYDALERKESWASGIRKGPREFFTGGLTDGSRIYYGLANSVIHSAHLGMELNRAKVLGYDFIKTYVRMPDSIQNIITTAAHEMGIGVSSHEIYPAMKYNVDAVEHIRGTSRRGYSMKQTALNRTYSDVITLLATSGMNITPTIGLQGGFLNLADEDPEILNNPQFVNFYSEGYRASLGGMMKIIKKIRPSYGENFDAIYKTMVDLSEAGASITSGTDSPFIPYGTSLHVEMQLFVEAGLTPYQALRTATYNAARTIGVLDDLGTVEAGKLADFVIVDGDPLTNIKDAWNVVTVFKNGIKYEYEELL